MVRCIRHVLARSVRVGVAQYPSMLAIKHVRVENASIGIDVVREVPQELIFF